MEKIVSEIARIFINNILEVLSTCDNFENFETAALSEAKLCAAKMIGAYVEIVDTAIASDKVARRRAGYAVERRSDKRNMQTLVGEVTLTRTLYKKAAGGYEYLADTALGIESRSRVSSGVSFSLVSAAREMSYGKSAKYVTSGAVSRQTVMSRVRHGCAMEELVDERRRVSELHIDADEDHVTLTEGIKSEVPLISVYEGIVSKGSRRECKEVFHISEYGKTADSLWEQALTEIERRYDLTGTDIYLHGDGAAWVQKGLEWIPNAIFVLDKYHKNKEIKNITAGLGKGRRKEFNKAIRESLAHEDLRLFNDIIKSMCKESPNRVDKIRKSAKYLRKFIKGISICEKDPQANNGGCTEPHVSHILSARLSSRPMAWSKITLQHLAPVLAASNIAVLPKQPIPKVLPKPLRKITAKARKEFLKRATGMPHPDAIGTLPINGKVTGTYVLLKQFA